jgi:type VI secretion system FHA domain protein
MHMLGIRVVSLSGAALDAPLSATFGDAGGAIGRGADCTLVLADPDRRISRRQALIACRDGRHFIRQVGANLAIELDGVPLALDVDYPLEPGARIRIGPYLLRADLVPAPGTVPAFRQPSSPAIPPAAVGERQSADDLLDAFNVKKRPTARASVFGDVLGAAAPAEPFVGRVHEIDLVVGDPTGAGQRPAAIAPAPMQGAQALTVAELFSALYAGLGLPAPEPVGQSVQQLRLVGALLRQSVQGTLELLAARAIAKRELGESATRLQARENNPLKFSPDTDTALVHLLGPAQRGFIAPLAAVADAFDDLRAHEVAVLTGMRAALDEVLSRFNPEALEQRLAPKGMWENLLSGSREAKLWVHYGERYAEILREVEGDFDSLFGRAFREAYESQLAELARAPARSPAEPT